MSYMEIMKKVKNKQIAPVYLLYGSENYFIQKLQKEIKKQVLGKEMDNLSFYDLDETPVQEVISDVETYPFFGERKLIIATKPSFLKAKPDRTAVEHNVEILENYLSMPVDYSVLVLIAPYEKIDERKKLTKVLKKNADIAVCNPIKDYDVRKWIDNLAGQLRVFIDQDAYDIFEAELSTNLNLMENELKKMALFVGEKGTITRAVAEKLISHTASSSSLRLVDTVIDRDLAQAIAIYKDLEKMKEEPIALIGLLAFQFRTILRVKLLKLKGYSQSQMQKQLGVHPYVIKIALAREKKFTVEKLEAAMDKLAQADASMKQGTMEKDLVFQLLLYDLINE
ncbi:DNA polymerase III subunit delta [Virgibacillus halodenitrificans]|uniref:DNA polymerase III subunit delta n=2 Tax=Virgibacillus halodenitrificans TaxID=1482 RepID=A0AAC9NL30_VIRHA|nr:DNA polymerase III subunit delta [Virgibacillus halodenitrificans]APC48206.1 DNA polymerase III subunit delta [Virgibacillus halodenitrificans]MBD1222857.1 DNA polymerase III subunit delta [Virgibacillus halodenitrificans]